MNENNSQVIQATKSVLKEEEVEQDSQTKKIAKFIETTFLILKDGKYDEVFSWNKDGSELLVKNISKFADEVLWVFFRHRNFPSFVRQLNLYDFVRCASQIDQYAFMHPLFMKTSSRKHLALIRRRKQSRNSPKAVDSKTTLKKYSGFSEEVERTASSDLSAWNNVDDQESSNKPIHRRKPEDHHGRHNFNASPNFRSAPPIFQNASRLGSKPSNYSRMQEMETYSSYSGTEQQDAIFSISQSIAELRSIRLELQKQNEEEDFQLEFNFIKLLLNEKSRK